MSVEQSSEIHPHVTIPESLVAKKDEMLSAWNQLPPEHQATMSLVLLDTVMKGEWGLWTRGSIDTLWPVDDVLPSPAEVGGRMEAEILDPHHFYAAYIFDQSETREKDITTLLEQSQQLGYPVRYWWLSDAMELQGFPDRLIVCVHHPSAAEDAGMDLYETLKEKEVSWNELKAAVVDEYRYLGKPAEELGDLRSPFGNWLFPHSIPEEKRLPYPENALLLITREDVREELQGRLGRELTDKELSAVLVYFKKALDYLDWTFYLDEALNMSVEDRQIRWNEQSKTDPPNDNPPAGPQL